MELNHANDGRDDRSDLATASNLPEEVWSSRPVLGHIRQAAHSRARCADAVLLYVLARTAALIPPSVVLPGIVGGRASLNFFGGIVSASGGGKTTAGAVARELVPIVREDVVADVPPGSGEGLAELYFETVTEEGAGGKRVKVKRQTKTGAYIYVDEAQMLVEMGNRRGATIMPTLRSAWSGDNLGQSNATADTHRVLPVHGYRMALMVGFQVQYAADLIADAAGGTPQRFVFATATDPTVPDTPPCWPGPLEIVVPPIVSGGTEIAVVKAVSDEVYRRSLAVTRGQYAPGPLDTHRDLVRLKVAALLAALEARLDVDCADWDLAGSIMATSDAVRRRAVDSARRQAGMQEDAIANKLAKRRVVAEATVETRALESGARCLARKVHRENKVVAKRDLMSAVSSKHRKLASIDDMIDLAVGEQWIVPGSGGYRRGASSPPT
jgi:hypothetical protein